MCSEIPGDANLYTLLRVDGHSIECPFGTSHGFRFSYNRGKGDCEWPQSELEPCMDSRRLVLNYQACPNVPGSELMSKFLCAFKKQNAFFKYNFQASNWSAKLPGKMGPDITWWANLTTLTPSVMKINSVALSTSTRILFSHRKGSSWRNREMQPATDFSRRMKDPLRSSSIEVSRVARLPIYHAASAARCTLEGKNVRHNQKRVVLARLFLCCRYRFRPENMIFFPEKKKTIPMHFHGISI